MLAANPWTEGAEVDLAAAHALYRTLGQSLRSRRFADSPMLELSVADERLGTARVKLERARGRLDRRRVAELDRALKGCEAERDRLELQAERLAARLGLESSHGAAESLRAIHAYDSGLRAAAGAVTQIRLELHTARKLYGRALGWARWLRGPDPGANVRLADRAFAGATRKLAGIEKDLDGRTLSRIDGWVAQVQTVRHALALRTAEVARRVRVEPNPDLAGLMRTLYAVPETGRLGWRYVAPAVLSFGLGIATLVAIAVAYLH